MASRLALQHTYCESQIFSVLQWYYSVKFSWESLWSLSYKATLLLGWSPTCVTETAVTQKQQQGSVNPLMVIRELKIISVTYLWWKMYCSSICQQFVPRKFLFTVRCTIKMFCLSHSLAAFYFSVEKVGVLLWYYIQILCLQKVLTPGDGDEAQSENETLVGCLMSSTCLLHHTVYTSQLLLALPLF